MIGFVLPTEPLGEQWIVGHGTQILKFLTKEGIVGFLAGISVCAQFARNLKAAESAPIWDHPAWGAESRQKWADQTAEVTAAATHFAETWAELMTSLPSSYGCELNCAEANAAADLYRVLGDDATAAAVLAEHGDRDEEGDEHYNGPRSTPVEAAEAKEAAGA